MADSQISSSSCLGLLRSFLRVTFLREPWNQRLPSGAFFSIEYVRVNDAVLLFDVGLWLDLFVCWHHVPQAGPDLLQSCLTPPTPPTGYGVFLVTIPVSTGGENE